MYAENPDKASCHPSAGLRTSRTPHHVAFARNADGEPFHRPAAVRIDAGVRAGDAITPYYDPMIAKLIVWGEDRAQALARMQDALAKVHIRRRRQQRGLPRAALRQSELWARRA